jgi:hypothetical protein
MKTFAAIAGWMVPLAAGCVAACGNTSSPDTTPYTVQQLLDPNTCNECHQDHFKEWSVSMHAYASTDPVFRAMNARGQKETNGALGNFCVNCHAPMAVAQNAITDPSNLDSVPQQLQGVTCYFCHNVTEVNGTHNNPLVLANDQTMRGGIIGPLKYKGHVAAYSELYDEEPNRTLFKSSDLCGSCHDIVVPMHFSGAAQDVPLEQTFTEWKGSVFADPASPTKLNCTSSGACHMGRVLNVPIANPPMPTQTMPTRVARHMHDFPAIDVSLTGDPAVQATQLAAVKDKLATEFRIEICADPPNGITGAIAITLENLTAGHNFPSGASQDRRTWVEVHAYNKDKELMSSGVVPPGVAATTIPGTWILYDQAFKADGQTPAHMFWDVATLQPHTIPVSTIAMPNLNQLGHPPFTGASQPDRVTVTIWVEPIGLDVIDDMIASGFLDSSIRNGVQRIPVALKGLEQPDASVNGTPVTYEWTVAAALSPLGYAGPNARYCVQTGAPRFMVTLPPVTP